MLDEELLSSDEQLFIDIKNMLEQSSFIWESVASKIVVVAVDYYATLNNLNYC